MKKQNYLVGILATVGLGLLFACGNNNSKPEENASTSATGDAAALKIAYVEIDTLLVKYNFCVDLNEAMIKKSENVRLQLNQKATELGKEKQEFQKKYENNAFLTRERAEQEYNRLAKKEQDIQTLSNTLQEELMRENEKNSLLFRDSINAFLKEYNKTRGYNLILSNTGFDNLLYADDAFNITKEVIDGLNARYTPSAKK